MHLAALLGIGLLTLGAGKSEYVRPLGSKTLDQATLDAEGYGEKSALHREAEGLRITLDPGKSETGWKTPQALRIGGDFTLSAEFVLGKPLPKPAQEDGAAVGLAIATQTPDRPDLAIVRLIEPDDSDVYRNIVQSGGGGAPQPPGMMVRIVQPGMVPGGGGKPPKEPRPTFPARGETFRLELSRTGGTVRIHVHDALSGEPRYLGQAEIGPGDIAAVKLFVSNRNGARAIDVLFRELTLRADRLNGLGTTIRTVFGKVVYGEPTGIKDGALLVGGQTTTPPDASGSAPSPQPDQPAPPPGTAPSVPPAAVVPAPAAPALAPPGAAVVVAGQVKAATVRPPEAPRPAETRPVDPNTSPAAAQAEAEQPRPQVTIPLDEIDTIHFERTPTLIARVLGQPDIDLTGPHPSVKPPEGFPKSDAKPAGKGEDQADSPDPMEEESESKKTDGPTDDEAKPATPKPNTPDDLLAPPPGTATVDRVEKVEPKPNGIRDLHLGLANLSDAEIRQITVRCQTDSGATSWRLDTSDSRDWPLVVRRSGREPWADLFLEPPPGDCHQKSFTINITYADNQSANVQAQADVHSDPKLTYDPDAASPPSPDARVVLVGGDRLYGRLLAITEDALKLETPWRETLEVPLVHVEGIHLVLADRKESLESFAGRLKSRGAEDLLLARSRDGEVLAIPGVVERTEADRLRFLYKGESRTLPLNLVEGLVFAERPTPKVPDGPISAFTLPGDLVVSGKWTNVDPKDWTIETPWGQPLKIPAAEVQSVRFRGGLVVYLSDIQPSAVEETPYFGHTLPWRRDSNLRGGPLSIDGRTFERGLAVHSRCVLTYDLDGQFDTFEALVGFDDEVRDLGRVECRVFVDEKELFVDPDLRADEPAVELELNVSGARQLRLVVEFGQGQDSGDRVLWADARLYRNAKPHPDDSPTTEADRRSAP